MSRGWESKAICGGARDEMFFPASSTRCEGAAKEADRLFCSRCPVKSDCLTDAIKNRSSGIWAGTTESTRTKLAKTRTRTKCPVCKNNQLAKIREMSMCLACAASWRGERETI